MNTIRIIALVLSIYVHEIRSDEIADLEKKWDYKFQQLQDHFSRDISLLTNEIEELKHSNPAKNESTCGQDWVAYQETKCFRVVQDKGAEDEAKAACAKLDSSATLISIGSKDEQQFLSNLLQDYSSVSENVWIGLEYSNKAFKWLDGSAPKFENWDENALKDGSNLCVQMSLSKSALGKWTDDSCKKKYLIACQKKASTKEVLGEEVDTLSKSVTQLTQDLAKLKMVSDNQSKIIEQQEAKLKTLDVSSVPVGFVYTQLPNQSRPAEIWPDYEWQDVTSTYAGLFFRAEGGSSSKFGEVQAASQSGIDDVKVSSVAAAVQYYTFDTFEYKLKDGWNEIIANPDTNWEKLATITHLFLHVNQADNHPRNTAIKFWKRTK